MAEPDVHLSEMPHDPLDAFLDDLRSAAADTPSPAVGDELTVLFRDGAEPVVSPTPASRPRRWSVRAAVAGAVAGLTFGGLGIAGALPGPVQRGVADVARQVGVELPDDDEPTPTTVTVPDRPTRVAPTPTTAPTRPDDDGAEGADDRRQGDDRGSDDDRNRSGGDDGPSIPSTSDDHGEDEDSSNRGSGSGEDSDSSHDDDDTEESSNAGSGGGSQAADRDTDDEGRSE
jgi:hypothetical protein